MTMYYSLADQEYVEFQRQERRNKAVEMGEARVIYDGRVVNVKDGTDYFPDMSDLVKDQS